jgi:hypothetical protein
VSERQKGRKGCLSPGVTIKATPAPMNWSLDWEHQKGCKRKEKMPLIKKPWWVIRRIFLGAKKNWLSPWGKEKIDNPVWRKSQCRRNEIDSCREAKKNQLSPWGEEKSISLWGVNRHVGGMKLMFAVRQRKINYCHEAKKKIDIAMRRELPSGGMKSILAVRQRKID